jgi:hypothetical protein
MSFLRRLAVLFAVPLAVAFAAPAFVAAPAQATSVVPLDDAQLAAAASVIALVRVERQEVRSIGRRILTFSSVVVVDGLRGARPGDELLVALPGGEVGGIGQRVAGAPTLRVDRTYLLFLGKDDGPSGARGVVGLWQGAFQADGPGLWRFGHDGVEHTPTGPSLPTWRALVSRTPPAAVAP